MRHRFQNPFRPGGPEPRAAPTLGEAFAVWLMGVLGALTGLWLAYLGSHWLLPAVLMGGLFALGGWRQTEWLWWCPGVVVAATALEVVAPLASRARFGTMLYVDLLALGIVVVGLVRAIALNRPLLPHTTADRPMAALIGLYALTLLVPGAGPEAFLDARAALTTGVVFYVTVAVASWPGGARWVWPAFPMAAGLAGLHAIWASFSDPVGLGRALARADAAWRTTGGVWSSLLVSLPLGFGLAVNAGLLPLRHVWTVLWTLGLMGAIALFVAGRGPVTGLAAPDHPAEVVRSLLLAAALLSLAVFAEVDRRARPHESPRWLAAALTLALCGVGVLVGLPLGGPARLLLAIAAGLVIGTLRADRRTAPAFARRPIEGGRPDSIAAAVAPVAVASTPRSSVAPAGSDAAAAGVRLPQTIISVVIVAYRSQAALVPCLASLAAARLSVPMEAIVVDNDSRDGTLDWIRREHPWVGTIASATNVGFARGVNLGVTEACGDLLLLLNPDCEVTAEALEALCDAASVTPGLAAAAPMLLDSDGRPSRSCGRFPDLWTLCCDHLGMAQAFPRSRWFAGYTYGERSLDSLDQVDWASGACLLIPREAWDAVGALDERMFMYMEEVDWCRRAARTGRVVRFVPGARIVHYGQMSSKLAPVETYQHDLRSRVHYFRKHHGPLVAAIAKSILVASLALKWGLSSMRATSRPLATVYARGVNTVWMA